ncbi:hypothetical protein ACIQOU_32800 [Streptomyces sp. NPDC091279]|uniref:hypothetical protein n=1 Tax=unclassified Streptomyces TaxID=2593676 RepID=UPI00381D3290
MATPQSVLTKTAVFAAALALGGLAAPSAQAATTASPAFVNLTVLDKNGAPIYAKPTSSSTRYRVEPKNTVLRIACSTTNTPSGALWYHIYDSQPTAWVYSGHFVSLVHPPKAC